MPAVARAIVAMQARLRETAERADLLAGQLAEPRAAAAPAAFESVRDWFYAAFLREAEARAYDIDLIARRFGVGFETACHRLSTLQRPEARGVPFFFIRVDRPAGAKRPRAAMAPRSRPLPWPWAATWPMPTG
ncbi:short-chain fatty acyl-CoA regulator family protein [Paracoccus yeei]|uniref:short-chain fatty acyl-CoA regulator family protein n=1 Tax=Paracoccus yeei TaxID=147645 RepID=UPI001CD79175|nr:short-chain fatty acyl-CoA regulator family protein [Paracoccus yeei]